MPVDFCQIILLKKWYFYTVSFHNKTKESNCVWFHVGNSALGCVIHNLQFVDRFLFCFIFSHNDQMAANFFFSLPCSFSGVDGILSLDEVSCTF